MRDRHVNFVSHLQLQLAIIVEQLAKQQRRYSTQIYMCVICTLVLILQVLNNAKHVFRSQ